MTNFAQSLQDGEKKKGNPNNLKLGFVLSFLSPNPEGACGQAFGGGQGTSGRGKKNEIEAETVSYSFVPR